METRDSGRKRVTKPRVSFTFRKLRDKSELPSPVKAPPIRQPCHNQTHNRILFISDSILSGVSDSDFDCIKGYRCVKRHSPELKNALDYEDDFGISDFVIFSGGINDLSCYGYTAESLYAYLKPKLINACSRAKDTCFIFNSLLHTRYRWLDHEVNSFNKLMFELSCEVDNFIFFDSLHILRTSSLGKHVDLVLPPKDKRGVHISRKAMDLVGKNIVTAIELLASRWSTKPISRNVRGWTWPLAESRLESIRSLVSRLGSDYSHHPEYRRIPMRP